MENRKGQPWQGSSSSSFDQYGGRMIGQASIHGENLPRKMNFSKCWVYSAAYQLLEFWKDPNSQRYIELASLHVSTK